MFQSKMEELDLFRGDTVLLKGKEAKETVCIALTDDSVRHNEIAMNRCVRNNLCLKIGGSVRYQPHNVYSYIHTAFLLLLFVCIEVYCPSQQFLTHVRIDSLVEKFLVPT